MWFIHYKQIPLDSFDTFDANFGTNISIYIYDIIKVHVFSPHVIMVGTQLKDDCIECS